MIKLKLATKINGETIEVLMSIDDVEWGLAAIYVGEAKK